MERKHEQHHILRSKRLFQQFLVDGFTTIESNRLSYIRQNQSNLRSANFEDIQDAANAGKHSLRDEGKRIFIPSSFTGGPRYMQQHYLDAMAICKHFGFPDLFITFTCNRKWPEITRYLEQRNLKSDDRPDIICRVFKMKLDSLMKDLTENAILGKTVSAMYTIEFQKRGLPHAHILLFMHQKCKFPSPDDIDKIICAEIPDKTKDPELYNVVKDMMIHGPCGRMNRNSPCMVDGKCSKYFPKNYTDKTTVGKDGYPIYRRRKTDHYVEKYNYKLDNRYVVPYNRDLSIRYRAHINVEWCNQAGSIKYLFKYIHKGTDKILAKVVPVNNGEGNTSSNVKNEVKDYFNCRYVSACEAAWRILEFPITYRSTPVEKLAMHLPGKQMVVYKDDEPARSVLNRSRNQKTQLEAFFDVSSKDPVAQPLTYAQIPNKFTYNKTDKEFRRRKRRFAIGRINYVPRKITETYHLRMLLNTATNKKSYEDLKTVDGVVFDTYKEACFAKGLLNDDKEYIDAFIDASFWASPFYLRKLFVIMLLSDTIDSPERLWEKTWMYLVEDIERIKRTEFNSPDLILTEAQKKNYCLQEIEKRLAWNGSSLSQFRNMPQPESNGNERCNQLILEEESYYCAKLIEDHDKWLRMATSEQRKIYDEIVGAVLNKLGGVFFVYGFGGTGKTYLWKLLSAAVRCRKMIAINVASSGIAALLLVGGRTAHSRFGIPINPNEFTTCSMKRGSDMAELVKKASLIIWDEAPMMSKYCFETLDRSMRDIVGINDKPFGGKVVVFGGDFRQVLPVIPGGSRQDIVFASLCSSYLWKSCRVLTLTKNMRLLAKLNDNEAQAIKDFSDWILEVGDGNVGEDNDGEVEIDIPDELLIQHVSKPIESICTAIYGDRLDEVKKPHFFQERAILCPTNDDVNQINEHMLFKLKGEEKTYLSADCIDPSDSSNVDNPVYSPDFLNSIKVSGLPNHILRLKVGCPIMLLRNIDAKEGLCNGTRLQITRMYASLIEAEVITGDRAGDIVIIPRITITPSDTKLPFKMQRRQFPLTVAFGITINKSQGQTLSDVGLFLPRPVFSHGQLYVAISRVTSKSGLKVLIVDKKGRAQKKTKNVVFKEIFYKLKEKQTGNASN